MDQLRVYYNVFEDYLRHQQWVIEPAGLYEPVAYLMHLGGKRLRPISLLLTYHLFDDDWTRGLDAALAVELFHNFTLAHDDIMDCASLRRGKPTMHQKFGENQAILSGDLMQILSYERLLAYHTHPQFGEAVRVFTAGAREICEGQQRDMDFERKIEVSVGQYEEMIRQKTAVLLGVSMKIGAILGGAALEESHAIYEFAVKLGIAFQIQDDWMDAMGDAQKIGKKIGGDIIQNKKTYLYTTLLQSVNNHDRILLESILLNQNPEDKVNQMMDLYRKYEIEAKTHKRIKDLYGEAMERLHLVRSAPVDTLRNFADLIMEREF